MYDLLNIMRFIHERCEQYTLAGDHQSAKVLNEVFEELSELSKAEEARFTKAMDIAGLGPNTLVAANSFSDTPLNGMAAALVTGNGTKRWYYQAAECPHCQKNSQHIVEECDRTGYGECPYCDRSFEFDLEKNENIRPK